MSSSVPEACSFSTVKCLNADFNVSVPCKQTLYETRLQTSRSLTPVNLKLVSHCTSVMLGCFPRKFHVRLNADVLVFFFSSTLNVKQSEVSNPQCGSSKDFSDYYYYFFNIG
ncbi:hypothetical protein ATANTOWER_008245 [Ataeniobius toweri]|uniref:Uncharacterized protein n=1 Tax=Ataeniobius toweri TaxID=208326 RepID=A0ABU7CEW2_9TELE|nr:hypothetical protein [Ataeniobius toweri]